jgi:hypothetical protein
MQLHMAGHLSTLYLNSTIHLAMSLTVSHTCVRSEDLCPTVQPRRLLNPKAVTNLIGSRVRPLVLHSRRDRRIHTMLLYTYVLGWLDSTSAGRNKQQEAILYRGASTLKVVGLFVSNPFQCCGVGQSLGH